MPSRLLASSLALGSLVLGLLLASRHARAFDGVEGARALGMANALRASPTGSSTLLLNPSGITLQPSFEIDATYSYLPQMGQHALNLAFVDSSSASRIGGGLSYSYLHGSPLDFRTNRGLLFVGHDLTIGLAYPLGDFISIGASGKYQRLTLSADPNNDRRSGYDHHHGNLDAAATLSLAPFRLAVVGLNVINAHNPTVPVILGIGASFGGMKNDPFLVGIDTAIDLTTWNRATARYSLGGEYTLKKFLGLRTGYTLDSAGAVRHYASAGVSLTASKVSLDLGVRQQANLEKETVLAFTLRILVQ